MVHLAAFTARITAHALNVVKVLTYTNGIED
jgi:hypothetical protein